MELDMIELTEQQRHELSTTGPVVIDPQTREEYVLVRRAAYDRLRALAEDGTVLATGELVDRIMAEDDVNDPTLAGYQSLTRKGQQ
jgi:hypothetical protein